MAVSQWPQWPQWPQATKPLESWFPHPPKKVTNGLLGFLHAQLGGYTSDKVHFVYIIYIHAHHILSRFYNVHRRFYDMMSYSLGS